MAHRKALLALLICWASPAAAQRSYTIERFDASIRVAPDASLDVTETITARFVGSYNGIYRKIPVIYRMPQGLNWTIGLKLQSVTDDSGRRLKVETSSEQHYIKFKVWIPAAANAARTIVLHYRVTNGLRFFDEHDELYWNVTGNEWEVPLRAVSARIELPSGAEGLRAIAFNGAYGSTAQDARVDTSGTTVRITMSHALAYREGLTAVVGWNPGVVRRPTFLDRVVGIIGDNWPLALPLVAFAVAFTTWRRRGRDPKQRPIAVQYEPPAGITPAEAGTLIDNSADLRDITSTLVDLAVRGYVKIEEHEESKFLGFIGGGRTYKLRSLSPPADAKPLVPHEQKVFNGVFEGRGSVVSLEELDAEFYAELPGIRNAIFDRLLSQGLYHARPDHVQRRWMLGAVFTGLVVAFGGSIISSAFLLTPVPFIVAGMLVGVILLVFALIMPARTEAGTRALEQVLGLEEFLRRVESETYKSVLAGHPELFDKCLPFAMVFGLEKKLARAFEGIYTQPPNWYAGVGAQNFSVRNFSLHLNTLVSHAGATMTSGPRSSMSLGSGSSSGPSVSWGSGFGGGGGGGGFSGGGGGGGGGGAF
ncbi:MAG TPA: DUF2207 domain-containing protein [Gemmatimonadales bacterium]|nr:DUF2207 domain-containing protein [Gemmatimonadales bacterium]